MRDRRRAVKSPIYVAGHGEPNPLHVRDGRREWAVSTPLRVAADSERCGSSMRGRSSPWAASMPSPLPSETLHVNDAVDSFAQLIQIEGVIVADTDPLVIRTGAVSLVAQPERIR